MTIRTMAQTINQSNIYVNVKGLRMDYGSAFLVGQVLVEIGGGISLKTS